MVSPWALEDPISSRSSPLSAKIALAARWVVIPTQSGQSVRTIRRSSTTPVKAMGPAPGPRPQVEPRRHMCERSR